MNEHTGKIQSFTDLIAWQVAHIFVKSIYEITKKFPDDERFGLTSQMRRAAVSITSNIAEGFGRQSYKERIQFFYLSQGSLTELKNQLIISKDVGLIKENIFEKLMNEADEAHKYLQGLIKKTKTFVKI